MAMVLCEVKPGLGENDVTVAVKDVNGVRTHLNVEKSYLSKRGSRNYLPIGVVRSEKDKGVALIELPFEADSGVHRLWVPLTSLETSEVHA
jgi:hypothetical protein